MPSNESDLIKALERLESEGRKAKNQGGNFNKRVEENLGQVRGTGQWKMPGRKPHFLYNVIGENIDNKVGKLSEAKARAKILPLRKGLGGVSEILKKCIDYVWAESHVQSKLEHIGYFGAIEGVGSVQTIFNPDLRFGDGDIDIFVRDPRTIVGIDPSVTDPSEVSKKAEYAILDDITPLSIIRDRYLGRGADVVADSRYSIYQEADISAAGRVKTAQENVLGKRGPGSGIAIPRGVLTTYWIKDRRKTIKDKGEYPIIENLTEYAAGKGMPFPGGRKIVTGRNKRGGIIVLEDTYNPYWDGEWDIDVLSWNIDIETIWGPDDVQRQIKLQEPINRALDAYIGNLLKNSIIRLMIDRGAMDPTEAKKFTDEGAEVLFKNPGREIEYKVPAALSTDVLQLVPMLIDMSKRNIGVLDPQIQKQMPSIVTGPAIEGLQLAVEGGIRTVARRMEEFIERIGQKLISRIFQFMTSDRLLHYVGDSSEWREFEFERSKLLVTVDKNGQVRPRTVEEQQKAYRDFRFAVEAGSSLAISRTQRAVMKGEFFKLGGYRLSKVMEEAGIENGEEEMQKAADERKQFALEPPPPDGRKKQQSRGG